MTAMLMTQELLELLNDSRAGACIAVWLGSTREAGGHLSSNWGEPMVPWDFIGRHSRVVHAVDHDQVHPILILPPQLLHYSLPGCC